MTLSIVISSYKYGHLASHCIESVLSQTRKPDKIYFVDDGIGDCSHIPQIYPHVTFVTRETNLGTVDNFQDMLNRVDTDYVMFLGADNWLRPDTLELVEQEIQKGNDLIVYDIIVTGELKNEILRRHPSEVRKEQGDWYWDRSKSYHGSMVYSVSKAKQVGGYNAGHGTRTLEDRELYNRLTPISTRSHIPQGLLYYRRHKENFNPC
jgi:glycosyltransferase involved in cell wall biosynthesis